MGFDTPGVQLGEAGVLLATIWDADSSMGCEALGRLLRFAGLSVLKLT